MRLLAIGLVFALSAAGCLQSLLGEDQVRPTDYIRDSEYKKWIIEVDYVQGHRPSDAWLDDLHARMSELVRKDQITIQIGNVLPARDVWTDDAIRDLRREHQATKTGGDTVVTWVGYLNGQHSRGSVLGVAYNWDAVAIFTERIDEGCRSNVLCIGNAGTVQRAVLIHEFGHIIGLVNRGIPMVNPHTDGSQHSNNQNSVMYAQVASTGIFGLNNIPTRFDSNDKLDICAAGGKGSC